MGEAKTTLSRRSFLKTAGAAGALAAAGGMTGCSNWLKANQSIEEPKEEIRYSFHIAVCNGHCSLKCTVRDGRLCNIEPNDAWAEKRYAKCCIRALSEVEHTYGSERIQTPMKRVGERGEGKFVSISWDEALTTVIDMIKKTQDTAGKNAILFAGDDIGTRFPHLQRLLGAQGCGLTGQDQGFGNGLAEAIGDAGFGIATSETRDWTRTKTLLMVGCNYVETSPATSRPFFEALEAGCQIYTIDPNFTTTAAKSTKWIPIAPGTDGALFMGMISAILDNGWYNEASMLSGTTFPHLVDVATGKMMRLEEATGPKQSGAENPFMVWDPQAEAAVPYRECKAPALEGEWEIDGVKYTTVFELLKKNQKPYTVEWAAGKTKIPAETIVELAKHYAVDTPSTISIGWGGNDKYTNADISGHAAGILAALTGNYGKAGASVGCHIGGRNTGWKCSFAAWPLPAEFKVAAQEMPSYQMRYGGSSVRMLITSDDWCQQRYGNMNVTRKWLMGLDYIVAFGVYYYTSLDYADIILPCTTRLESTEDVERIHSCYGHLLASGKVIEPVFDSKTDMTIEREIAARLGYADVLPKSSMEYCRYQIENSKDAQIAGYTLDKLIENHMLLPLHGYERIREDYATQIKKTPSGLFHVYYEDMLKWNQQLPVYEDPIEVYEENELRKTYPLSFATAKTLFFHHSMFHDALWIRQFYPEPIFEMNPVDMAARDLNDGDYAEVFNERGSMIVKVRGNECIRPTMTRMFEGQWSKFMKKGHIQDLSNDYLIDRSPALPKGGVVPYNDSLIEVKKVTINE